MTAMNVRMMMTTARLVFCFAIQRFFSVRHDLDENTRPTLIDVLTNMLLDPLLIDSLMMTRAPNEPAPTSCIASSFIFFSLTVIWFCYFPPCVLWYTFLA
jgi:hypothetical protein